MIVRDDLMRERFPILQREIAGRPLVYLDSAATRQKPAEVITELSDPKDSATESDLQRSAKALRDATDAAARLLKTQR